MKKYLKIASSFLKILTSNKPLVYWFSLRLEKNLDFENFGDIVTPYLIEKLSCVSPKLFYPSSGFSRFVKHSIMVGSIISRARGNTFVWGSGIIHRFENIVGGKFLAVRGPRTAKRLVDLGFEKVTSFGDPALLLPLVFHTKQKQKKHKIGLVSHYVDFQELNDKYGESEFYFISLRTDNVETTIQEIVSCEKIISTSLHGLIVAHAYGITAAWWVYSKNLAGDNIKFYDYLESLEIYNYQPFIDENIMRIEDSYFIIPDIQNIQKIQKNLLKTYPYDIPKLNVINGLFNSTNYKNTFD